MDWAQQNDEVHLVRINKLGDVWQIRDDHCCRASLFDLENVAQDLRAMLIIKHKEKDYMLEVSACEQERD
jgi:hypothetical protein